MDPDPPTLHLEAGNRQRELGQQALRSDYGHIQFFDSKDVLYFKLFFYVLANPEFHSYCNKLMIKGAVPESQGSVELVISQPQCGSWHGSPVVAASSSR